MSCGLHLSEPIFYLVAALVSFMWNMNTALPDPVCSTTIYTGKLSALHEDKWRRNCSGAHGHSPACFNVVCFFCRIVCQYLWKKIATCNPSLSTCAVYLTTVMVVLICCASYTSASPILHMLLLSVQVKLFTKFGNSLRNSKVSTRKS